ncbi:MAG: hypothetical protein WBH03_13870 [Cyclobacteriaceae bacterium]
MSPKEKIRHLSLAMTLFLSVQASGQSLQGSWLFNNEDYFLVINNDSARSSFFDYIHGYSIDSDTLTLHHVYDLSHHTCYGYKNGKPVQIACSDNSTPDSKYLITKHTPDSLVLEPVNRAGIAVSARLRLRSYEQSRRIIGEPEYIPEYYKKIKLYNTRAFSDDTSWDTIAFSFTRQVPKGVEYFDIQIANSGQVKAMYHFQSLKKRARSKTINYKSRMHASTLRTIQSLLNQSSFFYIKLPREGHTPHDRIRLRVTSDGWDKTIEGYVYVLSGLLKPFTQYMTDLVYKRTSFTVTDNVIDISTSYLGNADR